MEINYICITYIFWSKPVRPRAEEHLLYAPKHFDKKSLMMAKKVLAWNGICVGNVSRTLGKTHKPSSMCGGRFWWTYPAVDYDMLIWWLTLSKSDSQAVLHALVSVSTTSRIVENNVNTLGERDIGSRLTLATSKLKAKRHQTGLLSSQEGWVDVIVSLELFIRFI